MYKTPAGIFGGLLGRFPGPVTAQATAMVGPLRRGSFHPARTCVSLHPTLPRPWVERRPRILVRRQVKPWTLPGPSLTIPRPPEHPNPFAHSGGRPCRCPIPQWNSFVRPDCAQWWGRARLGLAPLSRLPVPLTTDGQGRRHPSQPTGPLRPWGNPPATRCQGHQSVPTRLGKGIVGLIYFLIGCIGPGIRIGPCTAHPSTYHIV